MTSHAEGSRGRRPSAISTSFRSPVPSPSPSPTPSSPGADGLSRRLSWSRPQEDVFMGGQTDTAQHRGLAPPSRTRLIPDEGMEGYDMGVRGGQSSYDMGETQAWGGSSPSGSRPFFHQVDSTASLESNGSANLPDDNQDLVPFASSSRNYPAPPSTARTKQRRPYGEPGLGRSPRNLASSVTRSPTFRAVSNTLRKASVRVSSIVSPRQDKGTRLSGVDPDEGTGKGIEMDPFQSSPAAIDAGRPEPLPPETRIGLRGKTLCVFSSENAIRTALYAGLNWPYVSFLSDTGL